MKTNEEWTIDPSRCGLDFKVGKDENRYALTHELKCSHKILLNLNFNENKDGMK